MLGCGLKEIGKGRGDRSQTSSHYSAKQPRITSAFSASTVGKTALRWTTSRRGWFARTPGPTWTAGTAQSRDTPPLGSQGGNPMVEIIRHRIPDVLRGARAALLESDLGYRGRGRNGLSPLAQLMWMADCSTNRMIRYSSGMTGTLFTDTVTPGAP